MAWEKTHTMSVTGIEKSRIWSVWEDVNQWHLWDTEIEYARLREPFQEGAVFELKPKGGPRVKIKIVRLEPNVAFTDLTRFPFAKMYGIHEMRDTADGLEVRHTIRIEGPLAFLWRKLVAENVAAGLSEQADKMIQRARSLGH